MAEQQKLVKKQNKSLLAQFQSIDFKTIVASALMTKIMLERNITFLKVHTCLEIKRIHRAKKNFNKYFRKMSS